jgi:bacillithiol biosynthesis cysteine-adding enzyme BshC
MIEPIDGIPMFATPTAAEAVLAACDGRAEHVPFPATREGLRRTAEQMPRTTFPRAELAAILEAYNASLGAPAQALENARRIAETDALVVVTGQQPCAALGPLYVLYKAMTTVRLASDVEAELGAPTIPIFWNASEDHDLDEVAVAHAPGRGGQLLRFKADLERWRGMPIAAITPDLSWQGPMRDWLDALPRATGADELAGAIRPAADEAWSQWFSRALSGLLGGSGLVVIEPQHLRRLSTEVMRRAIQNPEEIARLLEQSCEERADRSKPANFCPLDGPPVFVEREGFRRRVLSRGGSLTLRGTDVRLRVDELVSLATQTPEVLSSHAALRPVVQNALLPVVAQVLGPGELAYQEELYGFHRSELGAGRRMPVLWPRTSLTVLDARSVRTMERFGIPQHDLFAGEDGLLGRYVPSGSLAKEVRAAAERTRAALEHLRPSALRVDPTLERPLGKTIDSVSRAFGAFGAKLEAAEARARGFAPEKLKRLAAFVRPDGRPQERAFCVSSLLLSAGRRVVDELLGMLDIHDRRHKVVRIEGGSQSDDG